MGKERVVGDGKERNSCKRRSDDEKSICWTDADYDDGDVRTVRRIKESLYEYCDDKWKREEGIIEDNK
ncbi:hypothetical protein Pmani_030976 [Petrolisthes manimaculis]|uniref:Uncharacterized protein n=1 Tax=Petrolisthes manimaculis TaxID=1843537 RepID=A0AAE1NWK3_9EUCA|nr:hypothetical protein Pmani_030976 [Petrolisthes manimaculis]